MQCVAHTKLTGLDSSATEFHFAVFKYHSGEEVECVTCVFTHLYVWNKWDCKKLLEWAGSEAQPSDPTFYIIQRCSAFIVASILHRASLRCSVVRQVNVFTFVIWRLLRDCVLSPWFSYVCCDVQRSRDIVQFFSRHNVKKVFIWMPLVKKDGFLPVFSFFSFFRIQLLKCLCSMMCASV